jgi:cytochrome oxidase Cu insertion factor (SCO1/SenC/PrrC family)/copper(I)-binding protein
MRQRALLLAVLAAGLACDRGEVPGRAAAATFRGVVLSPALEKPDITLTDFNGEPYNLRLKTAGKVALLFFGYTHCPDVCPLHAANVAAVLKSMPFEERGKIQFLFVTTDPERDTPARLKEWLGAFDPSFVGLTAPVEGLAQLQVSLGVAPARKEVPAGGDSSKYLVWHGAQVLAFGLDNFARVEYPFGIRQEDWANDLPRLARGEVPKAGDQGAPRPLPTVGPASVPAAPRIEVRVALMAAPVTTSEASVYLVLRNNSEADTLTNVWSPEATGSMIHRTERNGGAMRMVATETVPVAAGETLEFLPGGTHVMLTGLSRKPEPGESFPLRLRFTKAGEYIIAPMVVAYADLEAQLKAAR